MNDYVFAVSRIRELENELLSKEKLEQLISTKDEKEVLSVFLSAGKHEKDDKDVFENEKIKAWNEVNELAKSSIEIKSLTVKNDFHNLKAGLKSLIKGRENKSLYLFPTMINTENFFENLRDKKYYDMPKHIGEIAEVGYSVLTKTQNAQLFDSFVDKETLNTLRDKSQKSDSEMFRDCVEFFIDMTNIKVAYSCSKSGKSEKFIFDCLCETKNTDISLLSSESSKGEQALFTYLETSLYQKEAKTLEKSLSEFEKLITAKIFEIMNDKESRNFSVDPLLIFYMKKLVDIKNVRIIFTCKMHSMKHEKIRERLLKTYV